MCVLIVFWDRSPIAVIEKLPNLLTMNELLDWYAKTYAFERSRLTGAFVETVAFQRLPYQQSNIELAS